MPYYTEKVSLIRDSMENVDIFRLLKGKIIRYYFDTEAKKNTEEDITDEAHMEYDVYIDESDVKYLIYQDKALNLILTIFENGKIQRLKLTEKPLPEIYYLNLIVVNKVPHIFYCILKSGINKQYRIYHHYYEDKWVTNVVDDIKVREFLNPISIQKVENGLLVAYYDFTNAEDIFLKKFDLQSKSWQDRLQLTNDGFYKLYIDLLCKDKKLHLVYSKYEEGNFQIQYERYEYENGVVKKEHQQSISNYEDTQNPTLIYYDNKLWITWIEKDRVLSRYSKDDGDTWSSIYLWKKSKMTNIVRYKYSSAIQNEDILLNFSFGKFSTDVSFLGFGSLEDIEVVPFKKKEDFDVSTERTKYGHMNKDIQDQLKKIFEIIDNMNEKIDKTKETNEENIQLLKERVDGIEEYLTMRSRGFYRRFTRK